MPSQVAPWLEDLDEDWVEPSLSKPTDRDSSVRSSHSRIPRKSTSSVLSNSSAQKSRNPLSDLGYGAAINNADRSISSSSVVHHDSVKHSPAKQQHTLEWKKRLVHGQVGYGDQTDLFGPSGLENIFQSPARPSSSNNPSSKLLQNSNMPPSSPPPWPSQMHSTQDQPSELDNSAYSYPQDISRVPSDSSLSQLHFNRDTDSALRNRLASAVTDLSGEAFSPVFISKHTTSNGHISYAALDSRPQSSSNSAAGDQTRNQDTPSTPDGRRNLDETIENTLPSVPEISLPDNLPTGTPPVPSFLSMKRVSSSASVTPSQSEIRPSKSALSQEYSVADEESLSSPEPSSPPKAPTTPKFKPNDESSLLSPPKTRPSQSPLKLFGNYDTFTSNRLLRRMSQLEDLDPDKHFSPENTANQQASAESPFHESETSSRRFPSAGSMSSQIHHPPQQRAVSNLSSFGEGELDGHDFEADLSFPSGLDLDATIESSEGSPAPGAVPEGSIPPFRFHLESSPEVKQPFKLKRKLSKRSTARSRCSDDGLEQFPIIEPGEDVSETKEGKRPRSSPSKAPTPKRRRTLVALDGKIPGMGNGSEIHVKITGEPESMNDTQPPPITVHAPNSMKTRRNVTRPRNPTPSQRRREQLQAEIGEATLEYLQSSPELSAIKETFEQSEIPDDPVQTEKAKILAAEVAAFTLKVSKADSEGQRNRSITTQDFLDEAMHIMSLIRAKGRPKSGLENVEETEVELDYSSHLRPEYMSRSASPWRVSRPPSREGGSTGWRPRSQIQHEPNVESHLQRFREDDDFHLLEASLRSLQVDDSEGPNYAQEGISIRDLADAPMTRTRSNSDASLPDSPTKTHGSHPSIDSSSGGRTIGTSSSRKSDNVANLSPEKVAHLIPEEVAGMTFDREKQRWVRIKSSQRVSRDFLHPPSHISSEDDPFNNIPDLTVDEIKELNRIKGLPPGYLDDDLSGYDYTEDQTAEPEAQNSTRPHPDQYINSRPTTRDSHTAHPFTSSTAPSKYSIFASSQQQVDTRATSWSNEELAKLAHERQQQGVQSGDGLRDLAALNIPEALSEETELADETFSSQDESLLQEDSETEELPAPKQRETTQQSWYQSPPHPSFYGSAKSTSLRKQTLNRGLYSAAQEQGEVSFFATLPDKRLMSLSVSVSRPHGKTSAPPQDYGMSSPAKMDGTFYLSDLPDFTVNEVDEERPSEKALARRVARQNSGDRYTMAVQNLVKTLTDVEPDEPYWEDIKQLNLRERGLESVHNLEDFCARLEDLDLSGNNVAHLEGAPTSIRRLNLRSNALSSLTAWSHLMNLQYLDISSNDIDNLGGICMLIHLRELRADDNNISSLDGIMGMDGLLKLSVRRNQLSRVDFEGCQLKCLEDLDLSGNQISSVSGIQGLASLQRLILDDNQLDFFEAAEDSSLKSPKFTCLSLQKNQLASLDVSGYTNLRYLNVDENRLSTVQGLEHLRRLDTLSMRKQSPMGSSKIQISIFDQRLYARSVFLSSNTVPTVELPHSYHSVQNLEMASCGLHELPRDFGLKFPNLRTFNVCFNSLSDLRPLLNISRLEKLHAAGNRISRLRKTVAVLARMSHLRRTDLRDNPITHGFYAPVAVASTEKSLISTRTSDLESQSEAEVQQRTSMAYRLPVADPTSDVQHLARLDEDTKLHRRVYDILLSNGCKSLECLDGMAFARDKASLRDSVWDRLVKLGVVRKSGEKKGDTSVQGE